MLKRIIYGMVHRHEAPRNHHNTLLLVAADTFDYTDNTINAGSRLRSDPSVLFDPASNPAWTDIPPFANPRLDPIATQPMTLVSPSALASAALDFLHTDKKWMFEKYIFGLLPTSDFQLACKQGLSDQKSKSNLQIRVVTWDRGWINDQ